MSKTRLFWDNLIWAAGATPVDAHDLKGASGLHHPLLAVGTDEKRRRLVVVSMEHDARGTALAQADLQLVFPEIQVIVVRPVFVSFSSILSSEEIESASSAVIVERLQTHHQEIRERARIILPKSKLTQAWLEMHVAHFKDLLLRIILDGKSLNENTKHSLQAGAEEDPVARDRELGVCGMPIYDFSTDEISNLCEADHIDSIRELLQQKNILQYFFPPPDQLALGLVDRCHPRNRSHLIELTKSAPAIGHPFGQSEIVQSISPQAVIDELLDRGLAVEGELSIKMGPKGQSLRTSVRFKPREGLLSKIINRISMDLSLKDLFGIRSER